VLVGYENSDDAGVYLLAPDLALVQTIDFFSPIVDDPYDYGQIAAANALSDIYAMGGQPRTALSIVAFPTKDLAPMVLAEIIRGGVDKLSEAGVALLGGHSIRDDEIKFGYAITGIVEKENIKQNKNARVGNHLILTKPLGTGLVATAIKHERATPDHVRAAISSMSTLNRYGAEAALRFHVDTMTDVTGFGLIGHAFEVARASHVTIEFEHQKIPILPGALQYSREGLCAGGLNNNREFYASSVRIGDSVPTDVATTLFDPQTSGGLLIFVEPAYVKPLLNTLRAVHQEAAEIGRVSPPSDVAVTVQ
jgi:selenide,water dikinase